MRRHLVVLLGINHHHFIVGVTGFVDILLGLHHLQEVALSFVDAVLGSLSVGEADVEV